MPGVTEVMRYGKRNGETKNEIICGARRRGRAHRLQADSPRCRHQRHPAEAAETDSNARTRKPPTSVSVTEIMCFASGQRLERDRSSEAMRLSQRRRFYRRLA
jgi:hypothetical protein